ncbi:prepilin-type cleavage/methylation domain-containing protein [Pleurocapsa sp. CCALA 161]|uniref:type IV pilin protein n=1 Tax=Pleurocapsa sp. CCALA 161 TaxID=2107688 RepID=UPI000D049B4D|nr:type II secretion system protein [Pleurocapsa sp. CCALA 161]PSB08613.1 prepilin-type cleavage/methylation domain-containing protein [Pleurocapsa sp. CCALA 161]
MNQKFKIRLFFRLLFVNKNNGFTLIELLVVTIILGILAAIALPNYLKQTGKAREVEIKHAVGTINRAQQAYHWERRVFAQGANDTEIIEELLGLNFDNRYIDAYNIIVDTNSATVAPSNTQYQEDGTRAYSGGVFVLSGNYSTIVCQSFDVASNLPAPINSNNCASGENLK